MPAKYPKPYFEAEGVAEATKGKEYDPKLNPSFTIKQPVVFLWRDVKRIEGKAIKIDDGKPMHFVEGWEGTATLIVFNDNTTVYTTNTYESLKTLFLEYLVHSTNLAPGLLGI
jgi:hypothetical protein